MNPTSGNLFLHTNSQILKGLRPEVMTKYLLFVLEVLIKNSVMENSYLFKDLVRKDGGPIATKNISQYRNQKLLASQKRSLNCLKSEMSGILMSGLSPIINSGKL